jgi:hypothetical protein
MNESLEHKATVNLLLDLVYRLEAQKTKLEGLPFDVDTEPVLFILEKRSGAEFKGNSALCIDWYLGTLSPLSEDEKSKVQRLLAVQSGGKPFDEAFKEMVSGMGKDRS